MKAKRIFSVILIIFVILNVFMTSTVYAAKICNIKTPDNSDKSTKSQIAEYVSQKTDGVKIKRYLSASNLTKSKQVLGEKNLSTSEINHEIFIALGYSEEDISTITQKEIDLIMSRTSEITTFESYVKVGKDGNTIEMTKDECISDAQEYNNTKPYSVGEENSKTISANSTSNDGSNTESISGWMKIITTAYYIKPGVNGEKGWYYISGYYSWLSMPSYRMTDAMSLFASNCAWSQNSSDYYSTFTHKYYNFLGFSNTVSEKKTTKSKVLNQEGVYFKWKLPVSTLDYVNSNVYSVYSMNFYVRGKCRVSDYNSAIAFNVFTRYEHTYSFLNIQPSFSWSTGSWPGVSVSAGIANGSDHYYSLCYVDYQPNRNIT